MRLFFIILCFLPLVVFSQTGSLTVFSENADPFFLYLNDVKQNETAKSTVRVDNLQQSYISARIVFSDLSIPPIFKKNISLVDENDHLMHSSYRIRIGKDREAKLQFYSRNRNIQEINNAAKKENDLPVDPVIEKQVKVVKTNEVKNVQSKSGTVVAENKAVAKVKAISENKTVPVESKNVSVKKPAVTIKKCTGWPIVKEDFEKAKMNVIAAKGEPSRMVAAKAIVDANCLMVSQVIDLCKLLASENAKITFAKFAYVYTIDRHNYSKLKELFKEQTNLTALEDISRQR